MTREGLHLANGDLIETLQSLTLMKTHVDKLCVHAFQIGQHEELLDAGMVAHVAVQPRVSLPPLFGSLPKESDIQQVCLTGIGDGRLGRGDFRRNEVFFDGIGVDAVVELGQRTVEVPGQ